jgi:hypothetical protein
MRTTAWNLIHDSYVETEIRDPKRSKQERKHLSRYPLHLAGRRLNIAVDTKPLNIPVVVNLDAYFHQIVEY